MLNEQDAELFESYWSFSVVRNPYDRFVSAFEYARTVTNEIDINTNFDEYIKKMQGYSSSFYSYVPIFFMPQYKFITIKNIILVDDLLRFENLDEDWEKLAKKLNEFKIKRNSSVNAVSYSNIHHKLEPSFNITTSRINKSYDSFFTNKESKEIVYQLYHKDFELFDYEK